MFCTNCGKQIDDNVVFCTYCGTAVQKPKAVASKTIDENTVNTTNNTAVSNNTNTVNDKSSKKLNIYAIIGLVLSICSWFFALFINYHEYVCTAIGVAALAFSIVALVLAEKKNYNLKGVSISGLIVATVSVILWPFTLL